MSEAVRNSPLAVLVVLVVAVVAEAVVVEAQLVFVGQPFPFVAEAVSAVVYKC